MQRLKLTNKLSILVLSSVLFSFFVLGFYFDSFLKDNDFSNNKKRMIHIYDRIAFNLKEVEEKLKGRIHVVKNDKSIIESLSVINQYQDKNNYNSSLLDAEKKSILNIMLEKVKVSLNNDIAVYDNNDELIAYITKEGTRYKLNYISYKDGKRILLSRYEDELSYISGEYVPYKLMSFDHKLYYEKNRPSKDAVITYHIANGELFIKSHLNIFTVENDDISAQIEITHKCGEDFFTDFASDDDIVIMTSLESKYAKSAMNIFDTGHKYHKIFQIEHKKNEYSGSKYIGTYNGDMYVLISLNKALLNIKLDENRLYLLTILLAVLVLMIILLRNIIRRILSMPLNILMKQIKKIQNRDYSRSDSLNSGDELEVISDNINLLAETIRAREFELEESQKSLEYLSNHDSLTSLPNRRLFSERLEHALAMASRNEGQVAIIFIDLDDFKDVNDMLGHDIGDELLKLVSSRLRSSFREVDTIARVGGDEFHIIIENFKRLSDVENVLQKIIEDFARPYYIEEHKINTTASIGVAIYPKDGKDSRTLIKNADLAMYKSKEEGRDSFSFFSTELSQHLKERMEWVREIKEAVKTSEEFMLVYQPKISLQSGKIASIEALIRWNSSKFGFVSPDKFISLAEETNLIIPLGKWILNRACSDFVELQDEGYILDHISINTSSVELSNGDMTNVLKDVIKRTKIDANQIELEITESYVISNEKKALEKLHQLREMGIRLAIDDFGTGYSSLSYLQKLPVTRLKIDKSFVDNLPESHESVAIAKAIIALAKTFNLSITAEGVETESQLEFLQETECDEIQGYIFSKPLKLDELKEFYNKG